MPLRTRLLSVIALVAVAAIAAYLLLGNGDPAPDQPRGASATSSSAPSPPEEVEALSVETITRSQPTGQWRARIIGRSKLLRSGVRAPLDYRQKPTTWTFAVESCSADGCIGTVSSTSGQDFPYRWDGRKLEVDRPPTAASDRLACLDETGGSVPRSDGAATHTYRYSFGSFAGSANRLTSRVVIEISTDFSGSCQASPDDPLTYVEDQVLTRVSSDLVMGSGE